MRELRVQVEHFEQIESLPSGNKVTHQKHERSPS